MRNLIEETENYITAAHKKRIEPENETLEHIHKVEEGTYSKNTIWQVLVAVSHSTCLPLFLLDSSPIV